MTDLLAQLTPLLVALVLALLTAALTHATLWLRAHTKSAWVSGVMERTTADIEAFVAQQAQAIDSFRGEDGKLDVLEAVRAKDAVVANLKRLWGPDGMARIVKDLQIDSTQVDSWIGAHVEKAVRADIATPLATVTSSITEDSIKATATATATTKETP